jgi:hypothetical protein
LTQSTDTPILEPASGPSLADPEACGEDLACNAQRMIAIAPRHCVACADYHIVSALKRLSGDTVWARGTRQFLLSTLQPVIAELTARDRIDVVVAACADTAVLSTCAHAVWREGEAIFDRVCVTVLDRCPAPLILCEDYAARHRLQVKTDVVDLLDTSRNFPADLIVLHNFLSFVPMDQQEGLLRMLGNWLKDDGRIVLWQAMIPPAGDGNRVKQMNGLEKIKAMIDDGRIAINEPKEVLFARLERYIDEPWPGERRFLDINSLPNLTVSAGLEVRSVVEVPPVPGWRSRIYTIVVAGRPTAAVAD